MQEQRKASWASTLASLLAQLIDFLSLVTLFLRTEFGWAADISDALRISLIDLIIPNKTTGMFIAAFGIVQVLVWTSMFISVWVAYSFSINSFSAVWPVRLLRATVSLVITAGFIPISQMLFVPLSCSSLEQFEPTDVELGCLSSGHYGLIASAGVALLAFVPFALIMALVFIEHSSTSKDVFACVNGRRQFVDTVGRVIIVIMINFLPSMAPIVCVSIITIVLLFVLIYTWYSMSYYRMLVNRFRCCLQTVNLWFAIASLVLTILVNNDANSDLASYVLFACAAVALIAGWWLPSVRIKMLSKRVSAVVKAAADIEQEQAAQTEHLRHHGSDNDMSDAQEHRRRRRRERREGLRSSSRAGDENDEQREEERARSRERRRHRSRHGREEEQRAGGADPAMRNNTSTDPAALNRFPLGAPAYPYAADMGMLPPGVDMMYGYEEAAYAQQQRASAEQQLHRTPSWRATLRALCASIGVGHPPPLPPEATDPKQQKYVLAGRVSGPLAIHTSLAAERFMFDPSNVEIMARVALTRRYDVSVSDVQHAYMTSLLLFSKEAIAAAKAVYEQGMLAFPESAAVHIAFSNFLSDYCHDTLRAIAMLNAALKLTSAFDERFVLFAFGRTLEQKRQSSDLGESSLDMAGVIA
ncbi:hypothetical protein EON62_01385, partial [archaeon]